MSNLATRKTKLTFETGCEVKERGTYRAVIIETTGVYTATVRLKGTRTRFPFDWASVYGMAVKQFVNQQRAEKRATKKAR